MHSLKPDDSSVSLSCRSIPTPINNGKAGPSTSNASHKWTILCRGNTSGKEFWVSILDFFLIIKQFYFRRIRQGLDVNGMNKYRPKLYR